MVYKSVQRGNKSLDLSQQQRQHCFKTAGQMTEEKNAQNNLEFNEGTDQPERDDANFMTKKEVVSTRLCCAD